MTSSHEFIKKFNKNISSNIKLANYSWFNLGGPAEYLFKPENKIQLIEFLKDNRKKKSNFAKENGISGFEFLSCIPGSIGGAVIMNSGCYGNDISKILVSLKIIDFEDCIEKEVKRDEIQFLYRGSNLPNKMIITSVKLRGPTGKK